MDGARDELLAGPGLAGDQDARIAARHQWNPFDRSEKREALTDEVPEPQLLLELRCYDRLGALPLLQPPQAREHVVRPQRSGEEILHPELEQTEDPVRLAARDHCHDRRFGHLAAQRLE